MTKTCSGCTRGTTIQADCMWCDECENAYQEKKSCELEAIRADRDLLDDANIDLNYKVIALTKKIEDLEHRYSHVCKSCYGVGEIGHQLQDGSYENHTCSECVGHIQEEVWNQAMNLLATLGHTMALLDLDEEGKKRGYIK